MFVSTFTILQNLYGNVEYVNDNYKYEETLNQILNKFCSNMNNNIIGDIYTMDKNEYKKSFIELYDVANDKVVKLSKKIEFSITSDEDGFYYINKTYNLYVFGESQEVAEKNLFQELKIQYDNYASEDDNNLDSNAKILKNNLLSLVDISAKG